MTKELQDLAWTVLPKEFKEEVKRMYRIADSDVDQMIATIMLENVFGIHNLTSDAEGEEMLMCEKSKVMKLYNQFQKDGTFTCLYAAGVLDTLFGSKCLPDESEPPILSKVEKIGKDCKAEPKFHIGQRARHKPTRLVDVIDGISQSAPYTYRFKHMEHILREQEIFESDLEPYIEPLSQNPTENCDNENVISSTKTCTNVCPSPRPSQEESNRGLCDKLIQRGFKNHNRLHLAAMAMQAIISRGKGYDAQETAVTALEFADALIAEAEKGGKQC